MKEEHINQAASEFVSASQWLRKMEEERGRPTTLAAVDLYIRQRVEAKRAMARGLEHIISAVVELAVERVVDVATSSRQSGRVL